MLGYTNKLMCGVKAMLWVSEVSKHSDSWFEKCTLGTDVGIHLSA